jgi:DNA-binding LacI/PurR family transcriptional regulator
MGSEDTPTEEASEKVLRRSLTVRLEGGYTVHLIIALSKRRHDRKRTLTLSDVAHLADVSPMTVSCALSRSELVATPIRERVLSVARKLGYAPILLARGSVQNRTATVGVIVRELANPFFAPILSAIHALAAKRGFLVVVGESARDEEEERRYVEQFQHLRIGGIIINTATGRLDHLQKARAAGTPVVVMGPRWEDGDYVATDDLSGGRIAARHLLKRGHRRIGIVRMADPNHPPVQARFLGFREVLRSAGVPPPDAWDVRTSGPRSTMAPKRSIASSRRTSPRLPCLSLRTAKPWASSIGCWTLNTACLRTSQHRLRRHPLCGMLPGAADHDRRPQAPGGRDVCGNPVPTLR